MREASEKHQRAPTAFLPRIILVSPRTRKGNPYTRPEERPGISSFASPLGHEDKTLATTPTSFRPTSYTSSRCTATLDDRNEPQGNET